MCTGHSLLYKAGLCPGGLCPGGLCQGVCVQGVCVQGGLCPGISVQGYLSREVSVRETPRTVNPVDKQLKPVKHYLVPNYCFSEGDDWE